METPITNVLTNKESNTPKTLNINPEKCWINTKSTNIFKAQKSIKKKSNNIQHKNIYHIIKINSVNKPQTKTYRLKSIWFEWVLI